MHLQEKNYILKKFILKKLQNAVQTASNGCYEEQGMHFSPSQRSSRLVNKDGSTSFREKIQEFFAQVILKKKLYF